MSSWQSFALKVFCAAFCALVFLGCGTDVEAELTQSRQAIAAHDWIRAAKSASAASKADPRNADALVCLAVAKLGAGENETAREAIARARAIAGDSVDILLTDAQIAYYAGEYDRAIEIYGKISSDSDISNEIRADALSGRGVVYLALRQLDLARVDFLKALKLHRKCAPAWYHLGYVYREQGMVKAALEQFDFYVHVETEDDLRRKEVQRKTMPALQEDMQRRAVEITGDANRDVSTCASLLRQAATCEKKRTYKSAVQRYKSALAADPLSYAAAIGLARAQLKADKSIASMQKAFESYQTACQLKPDSVATWLEAADLAIKLNKWMSAAKFYSCAVAVDPSNSKSLNGLIAALRKCGGTDNLKAAAAYQSLRDMAASSRR